MISDSDRQVIKDIAVDSIRHGLDTGKALTVEADNFSKDLQDTKASFVTLNLNGQLRGCIGHLSASQPLILDIAENAFSAAFRDPRFPAVTAQEFPGLDYHFSILSTPEDMPVKDEQDLLDKLQPGIDGIVFHYGYQQATFLPSVWEQLTSPREFINHLKQKAGLSTDFWHPNVRIERYSVEEF